MRLIVFIIVVVVVVFFPEEAEIMEINDFHEVTHPDDAPR